METKIGEQVGAVSEELLELLSSFPAELINTIPFEGSWTAAQVGEHLRLSDRLLLKLLYGPSRPADRPPDSAVENLKNQFLNFGEKLESPTVIIPAAKAYEKAELLSALQESRKKLDEAIATLDLTAICESPVLGAITRLEIAHFIVYHTQRHIHQLRKIQAHVAAA